MESAYLIAETYKTSYKKLHVSEQQQVDCLYSNGCNGGWMMESFKHAMKKGFKPAKKYPYVGYAQNCQKKKGKYKISSYYYSNNQDCNDVKSFLMQQPITVTVDATRWYDIGERIFSYYRTSWGRLNHAVLLTGFQ